MDDLIAVLLCLVGICVLIMVIIMCIYCCCSVAKENFEDFIEKGKNYEPKAVSVYTGPSTPPSGPDSEFLECVRKTREARIENERRNLMKKNMGYDSFGGSRLNEYYYYCSYKPYTK